MKKKRNPYLQGLEWLNFKAGAFLGAGGTVELWSPPSSLLRQCNTTIFLASSPRIEDEWIPEEDPRKDFDIKVSKNGAWRWDSSIFWTSSSLGLRWTTIDIDASGWLEFSSMISTSSSGTKAFFEGSWVPWLLWIYQNMAQQYLWKQRKKWNQFMKVCNPKQTNPCQHWQERRQILR